MKDERIYRLLVMSDSHGSAAAIKKLLPITEDFDYVIHLGDGNADILNLQKSIKTELITVKGNCDQNRLSPEKYVLHLGDTALYLTHGHKENIKVGRYGLLSAAQSFGCKYALFGHTHSAEVFELGGVTFVCPGSLALPPFGKGTYAVIEGTKSSLTAKIVEI